MTGPRRIDARDEYVRAMPVGTWFFEYGGPLTEHRIGILTPDIDMLRDTHRYSLCGLLLNTRNGARCTGDAFSQGHDSLRNCQSCARRSDSGLIHD